ncbi:MAG: hypothetical protein LM517_02275 [Nitrosomonas sp.]|nr:hypothetical protein [Nitrosomonas sp.]
MTASFIHKEFRKYAFESVPLDRDIYLMNESSVVEYEKALIDLFNGKEYRSVGYVSRIAVRNIDSNSLEISWYPNIIERFHEVSVILPRSAFLTCVDCPNYDEKPHIFVKDTWLSGLHLRPYSAFALIDAIDVKVAIVEGRLNYGKLVQLRNRIDDLAAENSEIAFFSFADSLLLKVNWFVGQYDSKIVYSYKPESLIQLISKIANAFQIELGMSVYAVITQGVNEYEDLSPLHISSSRNHISLNSLGLPFAQLLAIDEAARNAIRTKAHPPSELYIDEHFYHSLCFRSSFEKHLLMKAPYTAPMSSVTGTYFCFDRNTIFSNLDSD